MPTNAKTIGTLGFHRLEKTALRRRGFPSAAHVKRGTRGVETPQGRKEFVEKLGAMIRVPADPAGAFRKCCLRSCPYDGSNRNEYF